MFEISSKKINFNENNLVIKKNVLLDNNLDCFILISSSNENFWNLLINNILDFIIDKIWKQNTYKDFSIALENINAIIKTWKIDTSKDIKFSVIIWIINNNNLVFSNIWNTSCYLVNTKKEVLELTSNSEHSDLELFNYISNWELNENDIIIFSTKRLLDYLSKSDILDWLDYNSNINNFNKNLEDILLWEILDENILITSLIYNPKPLIEENNFENIKNNSKKLLNINVYNKSNSLIKKILKKINNQSKKIKNLIFISWIVISMIILYSLLSSVAWVNTQNENKEIAKNEIVQAKNHLRIASENIANNDIFELNIKKAEEIISEINKNELFLKDVLVLNNNISILKKQFNKIEIIESNKDNLIYEDDFEKSIKIIKNNLKPYVINKRYIIWPVLPNTIPKKFIFNDLGENDYFVDATVLWDSIYLTTKLSKIVKFSKNKFKYVDVKWQSSWEDTKEINSYWNNIYLLWNEVNQIHKHSSNWNNFNKAVDYFKEEDIEQIWWILSFAIDWWFYILKKDLSIIKFFYKPYRLEKIVLNKLPWNYDIIDKNSIIDIKTRSNLNYIYLLLNNKIWVFKPNSSNYNNTKSLNYLWQIEWQKEKIIDFYVNYDWEIIILNKNWLYKLNFEVSDDKIRIK